MTLLPPVTFLLAAVALILTPGPDTVYVLERGLEGGRWRGGVAAAAGVSTGILVHTGAVVLGVAALVRASPTAFELLRYVGACYLLALGALTLWRVLVREDGLGDTAPPAHGADVATEPGTERASPTAAYGRGVAVNVLNPKVLVFFLAFLPQFAGEGAAPVVVLGLGGWYAALTMGYLGAVGLSAGAVRTLLAARPAVARGIRAGSGLVLVGFAAELALAGGLL
jgi:threonine/homoserine/homoserine lactone efflux protein